MTTVLDEIQSTLGWNEVPFRAVGVKVSNAGYPNLEPLSVFLDAGVVPRSSREDNHNQLGESLEKYQRVLPNDLVFNKLRTWQGGFGISEYEGIVSPAYIIVRLNTEVIHPKFLGYLLKSKPYLAELTRLSKWMPPTQFDISWESIRDLQLRFPPIEEQRQIADFLSSEIRKVDLIIGKNIELLALLEKELNSHTSQVFRSISNKCKFKYRFSAQSGNSISAEFIADNNLTSTGELPFIATKEVTNDGHINYDSDIKIPLNMSHLFRIAKPGAVLLCSEGGSAGKKFAINEEVVAYGNKLFSIEPKSSMSTRTLFHIFRTDIFQMQFAQNMNGLIGGISTNSLGEIEIPDISGVAEMDLLQNLETINSNYLRKFDKISRILELLKEYKIALITYAVTGGNSFNREVGKIL